MTPVEQRVVVTGSAGFLGRHVVAALSARGHDVTGLDLRAPDPREQADIRHPLSPSHFDDADVVVHLAALGGVRPSLADPNRYHDTNVVGTARVLAAARAAGARRVILASSSSVYGQCPGPASETRAPRPLSPYAHTKLAAEALGAAYSCRSFEVVVVRPFTLFGPGQRADMLIGRLLTGERLELWDFERDFTPVSSAAHAIAEACVARLGAPYSVFNLGTGAPVGARRLVAALAAVTGDTPEVSWGSPPAGEPQRTWADPSQASRRLGFAVPAGLVETIAEQYAAMRTPVGLSVSPA
ncbi:MAG: NAD-dependent epimerase/dehydratase family protein [Actinobacteria bacterium]|nr:NAD-dependent epimerase/dehydratase family protein [Actinomycetota bacterium]